MSCNFSLIRKSFLVSKHNILCFFFLFIVFCVVSQPGVEKYFFAISCSFFLSFNKRINGKFFIIFAPYVIHVFYGLVLLCFINTEININTSIKQACIYFGSLLFSITLYNSFRKNPNFLEIMFCSLGASWLFLYVRFLRLDSFYYESNLHAYAFACFYIYFFLHGKYKYSFVTRKFETL